MRPEASKEAARKYYRRAIIKTVLTCWSSDRIAAQKGQG
jgi:hypothetical protein